ncbi:MAG: MBL fold metallo-hydrolase [Myxococcota bacterium]|nr:MBL fold metallo-hydrolase [Myxococcota bacterium]
MATKANTEASYDNHFDGERFYNVPDQDHAGIRDGLKWVFNRDAGPWDEPRDDIAPGTLPPAAVDVGEVRVTFVNHATVLIQIDGLNIITDPIYAKRASPVSWAGPRRVRPPGIRFEDLPKINMVLLSHNHYDHMCLETLKRFHDRDHPVIYTGLCNAEPLEDVELGPVKEFDWWQSEVLNGDVRVTFVPAQHFSNRGTRDRYETLWSGFVIKGKAGSIYFAGDTGDGPHFKEIGYQRLALNLKLCPTYTNIIHQCWVRQFYPTNWPYTMICWVSDEHRFSCNEGGIRQTPRSGAIVHLQNRRVAQG